MDDGEKNESEKKNKLVESVELFKTIIKWFQNIPIIIYFNKTDEFEEKIKTTSHLADYFPQFEGPKNDPIVAKKFIFQMFFKDVTKTNGISEEDLLNLGNEEICTLNICKQLELKSRYDEQHIFADFICATNAPIIPTKLKDLKIAIEESMRLRNLEDLNMI